MPFTTRNSQRLLALAIAAAAAPSWANVATTSSNSNATFSAAQLQELEQKLLILERKLELQTEDLDRKDKQNASVTANDRGYSIRSANGEFELRFNALAQFDLRTFLSEDQANRNVGAASTDSFVARRLRPTLQGSLGRLVGFRFTPEFAGAGAGESASIVDAFVDVRFSPKATLRAGKLKSQVGIDRIQSGSHMPFIERGLANELVPNRNIGISLIGELADRTVTYSVGAFNGAPDGRDSGAARTEDAGKEIEARLFVEPFKNKFGVLTGLGVGLAGTVGNKNGTGNTVLPRYRSYGQQEFFQYETGTNGVSANGKHVRLVPQLSYFYDRFGLIAEYASSQQELKRDANEQTIRNDGYTVTGSYVLTGEDATFAGVRPSNPFTLDGEGWGAFELVGRIDALDVDDKAFVGSATTRLANPTTQASKAQHYGIGLNWYLNRNVKISTDYNQTHFDGGRGATGDQPIERALFSRVQLNY